MQQVVELKAKNAEFPELRKKFAEVEAKNAVLEANLSM